MEFQHKQSLNPHISLAEGVIEGIPCKGVASPELLIRGCEDREIFCIQLHVLKL